MSTEKSEQKFISNNLLNKKRDKSGTRHKAKRKKRMEIVFIYMIYLLIKLAKILYQQVIH